MSKMQSWLYEETLFHWCDKCYIDDEGGDDVMLMMKWRWWYSDVEYIYIYI